MGFTDKSIKPKALTKNSRIALIAPAGPITELQLAKTQETLSKLGHKSFFTERILDKKGYLAGADITRLADLHEAFESDDADAILCIRGGYGSSRIIDQIDYQLIQKNPKVFIGYSDITALLNTIWQKTGLITFHGVVGTSAFSDYTIQQFKNVTLNQHAGLEINTLNTSLLRVVQSGVATGRLMGGNLSIINSLIGTAYEVNFDEKLIFLEDVNEAPYKIDRMLTQLLLTGNLQKASGIILGEFKGCDIDNHEITAENSLSLSDVFTDRLSHLKIPIVAGFSFGHIQHQALFPIGVNAELDTVTGNIKLLENVVA